MDRAGRPGLWGSEDDGCPALTRANYMPAIQFPISLAFSFLVCKMGILFTHLFPLVLEE